MSVSFRQTLKAIQRAHCLKVKDFLPDYQGTELSSNATNNSNNKIRLFFFVYAVSCSFINNI